MKNHIVAIIIVCLFIVSAFAGCTSTTPKKENKAPIAIFSVSPEVGKVNQTITFNPSNSNDPDGNISKYSFQFGDGDNKDLTTVGLISHVYHKAGNYNVTLIVQDYKNKMSLPFSKSVLIQNVVNQILIYDPTGNNTKSRSRSSPDGASALLVTVINGAYSNYTPVNIDPALFGTSISKNAPIALNGTFETSGSGGNITVEKIISSIDQVIQNGSFNGKEFQNVEAKLSSVSIVIKQHTFGFGYGKEGKPIAYVSIDKKPTFFTNVTIKGVVLPENIMEVMPLFLDMAIPSEYSAFQQAFKQFANAKDLPTFNLGITIILADSIEYDNSTKLNGDVIDVITPSDVINFIQAINNDTNTDSYKFITDILANLNMELIIMLDPASTMKSLTMWFIVGITDLTRNETEGLVTLNIAEIKRTDIERELGIQIPDIQINSAIHIRYGVTGDKDFKPVLHKMEVRQLWKAIDSSSNTAADGIQTDCFAMVMSLQDVITYLEDSFQTDMRTLRAISTVRNPAAGLIIDYNFTDVLDDKETPFKNYLGLVLMPDYKLDQDQLIHITHIEGVVYDMGKFLGDSDFQFPVIISDLVTEGPSPLFYNLQDIYEGALGNKTMAPVTTEGFATGTTMKTVAKYVPGPVSNVIKESPVDVDAYHLFEPSLNDGRYHTALISFNLTKDTGPTYFMQKVHIEGFYINMTNFKNKLNSVLGLGDDFGGGALIAQIISGIEKFTGDHILDGAIIGYKVIPVSATPSVPITELHCYSSYLLNNDTGEIFITGKVKNLGGVQFNPTVRIVVINEQKTKMLFYNGSLSDGNSWVPFMPLATSATATFSWNEQFTIQELPPGNYTVNVLILQWSAVGAIQEKLGEKNGTFTIFASLDEVGFQFLNKTIEFDGWLQNSWNVSINISIDFTKVVVKDAPIVISWAESYFFPVSTTSSIMIKGTSPNEWILNTTWSGNVLTTYRFYIIVKLVVNGREVEFNTELYSS